MKIKADFKPGDKITEIPASWFSAVGSFVNNLVGVNNIAVKRPHGPVTESSPVEIEFVGSAINLSGDTPAKESASGTAGVSDAAARADHSHPAPADSPDYTGFDFKSLDEDGSDANAATTWTAGAAQTKGFRITIVRKVAYKEEDGTPALRAYARDLIVDKFGRIYSLGAQFNYVIDTPVEGY